jgi:hypothetical protein
MEWVADADILAFAQAVLAREVPLSDILDETASVSITDDRPFNEYFFLRRIRKRAGES